MKLALAKIVLNDECQPRIRARQEVIDEYRRLYEEGVDMPALELFDVSGEPEVDPEKPANGPHLVDGWHRFAALRDADKLFAKVRVVGSGSLADAIWYSVTVNHRYGLQRSDETKRRSIRQALKCGIGAEQSTNVLAKHCGVSHYLASDEREKWEAEQRAKGNEVSDTVTTTDGRSYPRRRASPETRNAPAESAEPRPEPEPAPATAQAMPDDGGDLAACEAMVADVTRKVRARLAQHPRLEQVRGRVTAELKKAGALLAGARVDGVCASCVGRGCIRCASRGWRTVEEVSRG